MCLIINKPAGVSFSDTWLQDFFGYNQDGYGILVSDGAKIAVFKNATPKVEEFIEDMNTIKDNEALIHLRMRTHGDIDKANTHPYKILSKEKSGVDLWVMHNGILSNAASDRKEMSDTWHYIRDTLQPILEECPSLLQNQAFQALIGEHIGNNRLAFMDNLGRITIINEKQGVQFNKCWLSNTYAWSHNKQPGKEPPGHRWPDAYEDEDYGEVYYRPKTKTETKNTYELERTEVEELEDFCFNNYDVAAKMFLEFGVTLADLEDFELTTYKYIGA